MGLKENLQEFGVRLSGSRVRKYDSELKHLNDMANRNGHEVYTKASKTLRGRSFMPKNEDYRWQQVHNDPKQQKIYGVMSTRQEKRKLASKDTNRARLTLGGTLLGVGALTAGGAMLYKKHKERKRENEQDGVYYKEAADNSINPVVTTLMQVKKNFAHAPELNHMYGGKLASRAKDIATGKRIIEARRLLKSNKDGVYTPIKDTKGNKSLVALNKDIDVFNRANEVVENIRKEKERYTPSRKATRDNLEHLLKLKAEGRNVSNSGDYQDLLNKAKKLSSEDEKITRNATVVGNTINSKFNAIKKTRDNEIAKTVAMYGVPIAATAGGVMLYKKHKKKKQSEAEEAQKK